MLGFQDAARAAFEQAFEIRKISGVVERVEDLPVGAVQTDEENAPRRRGGVGPPAAGDSDGCRCDPQQEAARPTARAASAQKLKRTPSRSARGPVRTIAFL